MLAGKAHPPAGQPLVLYQLRHVIRAAQLAHQVMLHIITLWC
jgi:hypothetical protein